MAISAVRGLVSQWYTPDQEGDDDNKTAFEIKPLNGLVAMEVFAEGTTDGNDNLRIPGKALQKVLKHGLTNWKNFDDENSKPIKFSIANLHRIPPLVLNDIATEIISISQLSGDEIKN